MSKLTDQVAALKVKLSERFVPQMLVERVLAQMEQIERMEGDISAYVHIEQMLTYIDWVINLPWNERSVDNLDLTNAQQLLNHHHYGLQPVKDRILEYLAVLKLQGQQQDTLLGDFEKGEAALTHSLIARRAPILCLVGLAGTGKTTLAKSIAQAMGRQFIRIPFGGMSDALELRGQSRVRPDAEIGLILKGLRHAGTKNPVILLDEIDRVAEHARGDIMGVLIEILDPEQNKAFRDHYLDYQFDLSECLFVATANNTVNVATAVMDRLEPIQMPSYSDEEKITIAREYVLPELMKASGLTPENLKISDDVWSKLVRPLGFDSGIRTLERTINTVCRRVARSIVEGKTSQFIVTNENIKEFIATY